jgi:hypothetical protein
MAVTTIGTEETSGKSTKRVTSKAIRTARTMPAAGADVTAIIMAATEMAVTAMEPISRAISEAIATATTVTGDTAETATSSVGRFLSKN